MATIPRNDKGTLLYRCIVDVAHFVIEELVKSSPKLVDETTAILKDTALHLVALKARDDAACLLFRHRPDVCALNHEFFCTWLPSG